MTALERLVEDFKADARERAWYEGAQWERRALAEIHAMTVSRQRGIGQLYRHACRRVASHFTKET